MPEVESAPRSDEVEFAAQGINFLGPADIDLFDTSNLEFASSMQAAFADATQGFWESFPGSMDIQAD